MTEIKGVTWDFDGWRLDRKNALAICYARGFVGRTRVITAASVMTAESQRYSRAWHHNLVEGADPTDGLTPEEIASTDRGLFQVNDKAHPSLSEEEAFDPKMNVDEAFKIWKSRGGSFSAWAAYNSGAYLKYVPEFTVSHLRGKWREKIARWED